MPFFVMLRHSMLNPESSDGVSNGCNGFKRNHRATWIPACAGMTVQFSPRHSGLDPESSGGVSNGSNNFKCNRRATWIPACAGMTGQGAGMTGRDAAMRGVVFNRVEAG
ncbi:hypothetical protein [Lampropedia hyalina]|jgi:hypothetical protein|nr:hypothetical protein [Lampropedia hyalina]